MKRLVLIAALLGTAACLPAESPGYGAAPSAAPSAYPVHPDPLCFYDAPFEPGGPLSEVCA